MKYCWRIL